MKKMDFERKKNTGLLYDLVLKIIITINIFMFFIQELLFWYAHNNFSVRALFILSQLSYLLV